MYRIGDVVELTEPFPGCGCTIPSGSIFKVVGTSEICSMLTIQVRPNRYGKDYPGWCSKCYGVPEGMFWHVPLNRLRKKNYRRMDV